MNKCRVSPGGNLLKLLEEATRAREEDGLLMAVALNHGLRVNEVIRIKPKDIRGGFLTAKRLKGSRVTRQPLVHRRSELLNGAEGLCYLAP